MNLTFLITSSVKQFVD